MLLALATCHLDVSQAERLVKWIGFLSEQGPGRMTEEQFLLVASRESTKLPQYESILDLSAVIFDGAYSVVPPEREQGWPGSANSMFLAAAEFAEKAEVPLLFLEPDAIPISRAWFSVIGEEYAQCGKPFLGGYVPTPPPHMTGIGVYPSIWRQYAPSLANVPDSAGWDTYCAGEVNPHCHFTPLIQHVFKRHEPGWSIPGLNALDKRAVLFHQDKQGKLIRLLDESLYGWACARHPLFSYLSHTQEERSMTKFYATVNATKAIVARGGYRFIFDPVEAFAGSMPGVYATEIQAEQDLLDDLAQNPVTGVREIDQQEWEKLAKKNWIHPVLTTSKRSSETSLPAMPGSRPTPTQTPILPTPSRKAAVVVAEPVSAVGDPNAPAGLSQIKDINEVLRMDTVQPSQPPPTGAKSKTKKAAKKG